LYILVLHNAIYFGKKDVGGQVVLLYNNSRATLRVGESIGRLILHDMFGYRNEDGGETPCGYFKYC